MTKLIRLIRDRLPTSIEDLIPNDRFVSVTFMNPFSYYVARKCNSEVYKSFDFIGLDGISFVYFFKRLLNHKTVRVSFDMTSVAPLLFNHCLRAGKSVYFLGSTKENITQFLKLIHQNHPGLRVSGYRSGYFSSEDISLVIKDVASSEPDVVVVGMGTPKQDIIICKLKEELGKASFYSCGGFIHQTTKRINYYPGFIDYLNLRWVYRIIKEPNTIKRYLLIYPLSFILLISDLMSSE